MSVLRQQQSVYMPKFSTRLFSIRLLKKIGLTLSSLMVVFSLLSTTAQASNTAASVDKAQIKARLGKLGLVVNDIQPSAINGLMEVTTENGIIFTSVNGDHFVAGTLYSLDKNGVYKDVLAARQAPINAQKIEAFKDSMIVFKADKEKYVVTVFTDISCGYCIRLHSKMKEYNDLGITIRYLAFPRQGTDSDTSELMAKIWCAEDPKKAIHDVKVNHIDPVEKGDLAVCRKSISDQLNLGHQLHVTGTPAVFLSSGEMVGGYLEPAQLYQRLQQSK